MLKTKVLATLIAGFIITSSTLAFAEETVINIDFLNASGMGQSIGSITLQDSPYGLLLIPDLTNLSPGIHMKGDDFSDTPAKLGGGGARLACGVIP